MNKSSALIVAAVFSAFAGVASADEADGSQFAVQFQGQRTRAEVNAEAVEYARADNGVPASSRVIAPVKSPRARDAVRAEAVQYAHTDNSVPASSRVLPMVKSGLTRDAVRAQIQLHNQTRG